jgi:hypothetical protein
MKLITATAMAAAALVLGAGTAHADDGIDQTICTPAGAGPEPGPDRRGAAPGRPALDAEPGTTACVRGDAGVSR